MIDPAWAAPLGGIIGGSATAAGVYFSRRKERAQKKIFDYLVQDEILGHKDIPGVDDKPAMSTRLKVVEIGMQELRRELHPNGGSSLADKINETHRLATQALSEQVRVAAELKKKETE